MVAAAHADALVALAAFRFALVLADTAGATAADPWSGLEAVRDAAGDTPVVVFSAHHPRVFADFHERGFAGLVAKPFDLDTLLATVRHLVGGDPPVPTGYPR